MATPEDPNKTDFTEEKPQSSASGNGDAAAGGGLPATTKSRPVGGVVANLSGGGVPTGLFTTGLGLGADVSQEFLELSPTFGDVLLSVGTGVAFSQEQLDKGLVETAKHLSETKIDVITDVIQKLDDDGLPSVAEGQTVLVKHNLALINFVNPTVHEWKSVALSLDLTVGAMDNESGMSFKNTQSSVGGGVSASYTRSFFPWNFSGWFEASTATQSGESRSRQEADWASGQMRLDAILGVRPTNKFPVPAQITIGPSIIFSQGSVQVTTNNNVVTERSIEILISVRKAAGGANPEVGLVAATDRFAFSWVSDATFDGSITNDQGQAKLKVVRDIPNPIFSQPTRVKVTVSLGAVSRDVEVVL